MGCVQDTLANGRPFRVMTVVDNWSRHSPLREIGLRLSGETVGQALDQALNGTLGPRPITVIMGRNFNRERSKMGPIVGAYSSISFDRDTPWKMPSLNHVTDA